MRGGSENLQARTAAGDAGIGGQATVRRMVDAPVGVAGLHGLLCFTSLADGDKFETPPLLLLPISFLEAVRSIIDLGLGELRTPGGLRAAMHRLPSGHRAISVVDFEDSPWQVPLVATRSAGMLGADSRLASSTSPKTTP